MATLFFIAALILLFVILPILILWTRDKIKARRYRETPAQRETRIAAWRDRMLHPRPEEIESQRGALISRKLLDMYADTAVVLSQNIDFCPTGKDPTKDSRHIAKFLPLHAEDQKHTWDLSEFGKACCFADDGMGNLYWMEMTSERLSDGPVFLIWHDGWDNEKVANTLEEFLSWPRTNRKTEKV